MKSNAKFAMTPIAAAISAALAPGAQAAAQAVAEEEDGRATLEEIIVTATKRTQSVQDIPASVQALTQADLAAMGANNIEDYGRFVPTVNVVSYSATNYNIVFRGATIDAGGYVAQNPASIYLDEVSVTSTGSQPSIRMVDIERVEALSGPQGTLYGSDAQSGTMRVITNKPLINTFEAVVDVGVKGGDQSDMSYDGSLVFNIPLVEDKMALRLVGFGAHDGGFIDNVPGSTPDSSAIGAGWTDFPFEFGTLDNSGAVQANWNDADIYGGRVALLWQMTDNWSATVSWVNQTTEQGADSDYDPFVGDLQVIRFNKEFTDDSFDMYSLVVEGDMGFAQLVSATSYYDRKIERTIDNTVYHHYWAGLYCLGYDPDMLDLNEDGVLGTNPNYYYISPDGYYVYFPVYCHAPTVFGDYLSAYDLPAQQERFTQEFRLSSTGDTLDWLLGLYYEESTNAWQAPFAYPTSNSYQDSVSLDYWQWYLGDTFPEARMHWYSDSSTDWEQTAIFGEATWHATDNLDVTLGGRYFDRTNVNTYFVEHPETRLLDEYLDADGNPAVPQHTGQETKFIPKIAVSYGFGEDSMVYGLWTEGYRPGGTNRSRGEPFFPTNYFPDKLTNWETGYRSSFAQGAGRFNGTLFYMQWDDYQLEIVDPSQNQCPAGGPSEIPNLCGQPWQAVVANAGEAHIAGVTVELDYAVNDNWLLGFNGEWLQAETDSTLDLNGDGTINVQEGNRLPTVPELKFAAWVDYTWPMSSLRGDGFVRLQWSFTGDSFNILEPVSSTDGNSADPRLLNEAYNIGDIRGGVRGEDWEASIYVTNITDERAAYTHQSGIFEWAFASATEGREHVARRYTNRPRELGVRYTKHWGN